MKLLFVCNNLNIGGIQKSLLNLLSCISDKHKVTLYLFYPEGELSDDVPGNVKIIKGNFLTRIMGMDQAEAKRRGIFTFLHRSFWAAVTKVFGTKLPFGVLTRLQKIKGEYDAAISFSQNSEYKLFYGGCNEFAVNAVSAKQKISFVHCDFKNYIGNNAYNRSYYKNFDKIACVSRSVKEVFDSVCPEYKDKTHAVYNCYDFEKMKELGDVYSPQYIDGALNIFTAARISEEKGIMRMLPIFARLKDKGYKFNWRIAGDGVLFHKAKEEKEKLMLSDCVDFLGALGNPYPFFAKADLLLVPSYDEAAPMVYGEAEYFSLPILTTDTTSAKELVEDKNIGFAVENSDIAIENKLAEILQNPQLLKEKRRSEKPSNDEALLQFEKLISEV